MLQPHRFGYFSFFLWFLTVVAVCISVTRLKTGAKHRRSRRPCWRAGPTTTWLTLTITWMIWGTTGPTLWSTSPSWICANSPNEAHCGGAHWYTLLRAPCSAAHKRSTRRSPCPIQSADGKQRCTESRATAANALLACSHFKKVKTRWGSNVWWIQNLTWHFFCFDFWLFS